MMIKSLEDSGKLMILKRSSVLGNISEVDVIYRDPGEELPKVQEGENCVLLYISIEYKKNLDYQNAYYVVYVPRLQKIGWLWGNELKFVD